MQVLVPINKEWGHRHLTCFGYHNRQCSSVKCRFLWKRSPPSSRKTKGLFSGIQTQDWSWARHWRLTLPVNDRYYIALAPKPIMLTKLVYKYYLRCTTLQQALVGFKPRTEPELSTGDSHSTSAPPPQSRSGLANLHTNRVSVYTAEPIWLESGLGIRISRTV